MRESAMWFRIAMLISKGAIRSQRPWIKRMGAAMTARAEDPVAHPSSDWSLWGGCSAAQPAIGYAAGHGGLHPPYAAREWRGRRHHIDP